MLKYVQVWILGADNAMIYTKAKILGLSAFILLVLFHVSSMLFSPPLPKSRYSKMISDSILDGRGVSLSKEICDGCDFVCLSGPDSFPYGMLEACPRDSYGGIYFVGGGWCLVAISGRDIRGIKPYFSEDYTCESIDSINYIALHEARSLGELQYKYLNLEQR